MKIDKDVLKVLNEEASYFDVLIENLKSLIPYECTKIIDQREWKELRDSLPTLNSVILCFTVPAIPEEVRIELKYCDYKMQNLQKNIPLKSDKEILVTSKASKLYIRNDISFSKVLPCSYELSSVTSDADYIAHVINTVLMPSTIEGLKKIYSIEE